MPESVNTAVLSDNLLTELAEVVAMLVLVLMIFLALAWVYKRLSMTNGRSSSAAQVLGSTSLGGKERVVIVQVEDARLVLGVTAANVNVLHVLGNDQSCENASVPPDSDSRVNPASGAAPNFSAILSNVLGNKERASC